VLSLLDPELKHLLIDAYAVMTRANTQIDAIAPAQSAIRTHMPWTMPAIAWKKPSPASQPL